MLNSPTALVKSVYTFRSGLHEKTMDSCLFCLEADPEVGLTTRQCCDAKICQPCVQEYVNVSVKSSESHVTCPNKDCNVPIGVLYITALLDQKNFELYCQLKKERDSSNNRKTCPYCSHAAERFGGKYKTLVTATVTCERCSSEWCFDFQSPLHPGASCRENTVADEGSGAHGQQQAGKYSNSLINRVSQLSITARLTVAGAVLLGAVLLLAPLVSFLLADGDNRWIVYYMAVFQYTVVVFGCLYLIKGYNDDNQFRKDDFEMFVILTVCCGLILAFLCLWDLAKDEPRLPFT